MRSRIWSRMDTTRAPDLDSEIKIYRFRFKISTEYENHMTQMRGPGGLGWGRGAAALGPRPGPGPELRALHLGDVFHIIFIFSKIVFSNFFTSVRFETFWSMSTEVKLDAAICTMLLKKYIFSPNP